MLPGQQNLIDLPAVDHQALLQAIALPVLCLDPQGEPRWANVAAQHWLGWEPGQTFDALWRDPRAARALHSKQPCSLELELAGSAGWALAHSSPLPAGGWALTLQSQQELRAAKAAVAHGAELLDLARDFGRLGVWERDVRTLKGRWDRQVLSFWGLDPDAPTPDLSRAEMNVLEVDRAPTNAHFQNSLKQAGRYSTRYRVRAQDGRLRRIHSQWLVKNGGDGQPERVLGLMMDDSEPYALAQSTSELESQLALAVELGGIAVWRHDLISERMHYNIQGWKTLGMDVRPEGLTLDEVRSLIHPDDLPQVVASAQQALQQDDPVDLEARYRHADGSWRNQLLRRSVLRDAQGKPIAFLGVALDVTEQLARQRQADELSRRAEQALRNAEQRVALATRAAGLGTWELDLGSHQLLWDEQMWRLRGQEPQDGPVHDQVAWSFVHPGEREGLRELIHAALAEGSTLANEFRVVWPDGQVRWLSSRSTEVRDPESGRRRRIGVDWDVTESRNVETARREREIALRESIAKSRFLARMSHELRTPLNAVLGFAQLLLADGHADDVAAKTRRQRTEYIRDAGEHLMRLINDVLELSAFQGGEARIDLRVVALETLVSETLPLLGPLQAAHQISMEVGPMTEHVLADPMRLRQVLLNLLTNAVKYNRMGGSVRVDAQRHGDSVLLRVTDTGCGMAPDQMQELFEPFNRLGADRGSIEGTGIGLSIVKALMERMGGSVQVDSRIGEGSVFELRLAGATPADGVADDPEMAAGLHEADNQGGPESSLAPRVASLAAQQPQRPGLEEPFDQVNSILYIEDNPVNAIIVSEMLARRKDIVLHLASDGGSGLALARSTRPQLILLDMQLPDFDGFEVLSRLKADPATAAIRCIALSANAVPEDIARALSAGVSDYWTKPLDLGVFMAALDRLFGKLS